MTLPDEALRALKVAHVLAAVLFLGNVIVTGVWSAILFQRRAVVDFRITARAIVITDWAFTFGGAVLLVATCVVLAVGRGYPIWETRWIREAMIGLGIATVVWLTMLVPAQRAMSRLPADAESRMSALYQRWNAIGFLAVVPLLWSLWCMVYKPT
jgi:uncharacterized membrane protein